MPMTRSPSQRIGKVGRSPLTGAVVMGVLLLHGSLWWILTGRMLRDVPSIVAGATDAGWQMTSSSAHRAGWPFAAAVRFTDVTATRMLGGAVFRWTAEQLTVSVAAFDPRAAVVAVQGEQTLAAGDGTPLHFHAAKTGLRLPFTGSSTPQFDMEDATVDTTRGLHLGRVTGIANGLGGSFTANQVTISPPLRQPFDGPLTATAILTFSTPFPNAATPQASAKAWQAAGGTIELPRLELAWGPLHVIGTAKGNLNASLQPEGQAALQLDGAAEAIDAIALAGLLATGPASAARGVLGLLTLSGNVKGAVVPITLSNQILSVARFPVLRVPVLDWDPSTP